MKQTKFDKAMDNQEVLYPVLVQFIKEVQDEDDTTNNPKG
jgi:hypothetical protein